MSIPEQNIEGTVASSPVVAPEIPKGIATKYGQAGTVLFGVFAAVTAVLKGDHTPETLTFAAMSASALITLMAGRFAQAAAWYHAQGQKTL